MDYIEININSINGDINILIDCKKNRILINEKNMEINNEKINELLRIIINWQSNYKNKSNLIDGENFKIKLIKNNKIKIIEGNGNYPDNYYLLKRLIGEFNG